MRVIEVRDARPDGGEGLLAVVLRNTPVEPGLHFYTPPQAVLQFGAMGFGFGHEIVPHHHVAHERRIVGTGELLIVRAGYISLNIYTTQRELIRTVTMGPGDIVLLCGGGHGFTCLTPCDIAELKQGPYLGLEDKVKWKQ